MGWRISNEYTQHTGFYFTMERKVYLNMISKTFTNSKDVGVRVKYLDGLFTMKNFKNNMKATNAKLKALCENVDTDTIWPKVKKWGEEY